MRTQARSDCGHCVTGPSTVVDQSTARIRAPMSPPPANTDSINCVLLRSMGRPFGSGRSGLSGGRDPVNGSDGTSWIRRSYLRLESLETTNARGTRKRVYKKSV